MTRLLVPEQVARGRYQWHRRARGVVRLWLGVLTIVVCGCEADGNPSSGKGVGSDASVSPGKEETARTPPEESTCPELTTSSAQDGDLRACELLVRSHLGMFPKRFNYTKALQLTKRQDALRALLRSTADGKTSTAALDREVADADMLCLGVAGVSCRDAFPVD
jgi:hypothetical protein